MTRIGCVGVPRRKATLRLTTRGMAAAAAGLALLLGAGGVAAQGKAQKLSKNLVQRAEDTLKKIEEAEKQLEKVTERYGKLLDANKVKDRSQEHGKVQDELKNMENRTKDVRDKSRDMEKEASKFFSEWEKGLEDIKDTELRGLSRQGLTETRDGYGKIVSAGRATADQYDAFVTTLGNQLKYLEVDMSDAAIDKLKSSSQDLRGEAKELQSRVKGLKAEIKSYVAALQ
jgi:DNA mismatch repair ATPase MutS